MPRPLILIVEDQKDILRLICANLEKDGFRALSTSDPAEGLALALRRKPDLLVLDVMLPGMDGFELCRRLRQTSQVPVIFLTAKGGEVDRILGLRLGADDYMVKPFSVGELLARIHAVLRRSAAKPASAAPGPVRLGKLTMDPERHEVTSGGKPVALTPKEFALLEALIKADGKVLSREDLLEHIWGHDKSLDLDTRTVDQHLARLRKKLGSEGRRIATVTNLGYRVKAQ
ncbi:MAG: response regulator transcription factor [Elusimicrobia bacterium]|nr:response regulator transcription factor [Elusimicrobiota bacterium]